MRNTRLFTAGGIVILLMLVFLIQLGCGGDEAPTGKTDDTTKDATADTAKPDDTTEEPEAVAAVYACPMHPEETSANSEDKCSVCGMPLELQEDDAADDAEDEDEDEGEDEDEDEAEADPHAGHDHGK